MGTQKILTQAQAEAVYRVMVELNNVSAEWDVRLSHPLRGLKVHVTKHTDGTVQCWLGDAAGYCALERGVEDHPSQDAFAQAYGLTQGAAHE
jgi:hypothetical protein